MKKILKYTLPAACILALTAACSEKIDPVSVPETDGPEIRFSVEQAEAGTKGLINPTTPASGTTPADYGLAVKGTQLHVVDILTGFYGTVNGVTSTADEPKALTYIDGTLEYSSDTPGQKNEDYWQFVSPAPKYYRWTKTGTHTFFGYLTKDPEGSTFTAAKMGTGTNTKKLFVGSGTNGTDPLELKPATTLQFDLLFSDIVTRDAAVAADHAVVPFAMKHLFTALAVDVVNATGEEITNLSVTFTKMHPKQSATIDWGTPLAADANGMVYPTVAYSPTLAEQATVTPENMTVGTLDSVPVSTILEPVPEHFYDGEYRLLWPQAILAPVAATENAAAVSGSEVSVTYTGCTVARTANLSDLKDSNENPITTFEAGKKYLLTITITPLEVRFNIIVTDLVNRNNPDNPSGSYNGETFYFES